MEETTRKDGKGSKAEKRQAGQAGQQTLFQVGLLEPNALLAVDSQNHFVSKELKEAGEKPHSSISSVGER